MTTARWCRTCQGEGPHLPEGAGVIAGLDVAEAVFARIDPELRWKRPRGRGRMARRRPVAEVEGPAAPVLAGERVALNFLGRLSGVATLTARFVAAVEGTGARILDTRKTTPGLRALEKRAVPAAGGHNHRAGLFDAVLVKENHAALAGGVGAAAARRPRGGAGRRCWWRSSARRWTRSTRRSPPGGRASCSTTWRSDDLREAVRACARPRRDRGLGRDHARDGPRHRRDRRRLHQRRRADAFGARARSEPDAAASRSRDCARRQAVPHSSLTRGSFRHRPSRCETCRSLPTLPPRT